jgi:hypothetical protein
MPACIRAIGSILNVVVMGENRIGMLQTLKEGPALGMHRLWEVLEISEQDAMRRKLFCILDALRKDGFVVLNNRKRWAITTAGMAALATLRGGETIEILEDAA